MLTQMLAANKVLDVRVLAADKVGGIEGGDGLKRMKLKTRRSES